MLALYWLLTENEKARTNAGFFVKISFKTTI